MAAFPLESEVRYPESDGRPLGETERHFEEITDLVYALKERYRDDPDVYVGADMFVYSVEGDPRAVVCPDVFVVFGVPKREGERRTFKLWEEGQAPALVIEVTSASSQTEDLDKKERYARIGVQEYFLFDPLNEYLHPRLQGFRLTGGWYRPIRAEMDGSLVSEVTGLRLRVEGERLRLVDLATGEELLRPPEEAAARRVAEEEVERLRREIARLRDRSS